MADWRRNSRGRRGSSRDIYESGFGTRRPVKDGIKATTNLKGETWWSKRWINVLESFGIGTRLSKGRSYARSGQVLALEISTGKVKAEVQGSMVRPYKITIELKPLKDEEWEKVSEAMARQAVFAAMLLAGEMPQNIEETFSEANVSLMPQKLADCETYCSCPDWSNPCKHIAAVYYLLAERFDEDPFLIFKLRGRSKEEIIAALRQKREVLPSEDDLTMKSGAADQPVEITILDTVLPLEECLERFWDGPSEDPGDSISIKGPEVENAMLKRLGEVPVSSGNENINALLARAYNITRTIALKRAEGED